MGVVHCLNFNEGRSAGQEAQPIDLHLKGLGIFSNVIRRLVRVEHLHAFQNVGILDQHLFPRLCITGCGDGRQQMRGLVIAAETPIIRSNQRHNIVGIDDVMDVAIFRIRAGACFQHALRRFEGVAVQVSRNQTGLRRQTMIIKISCRHIGHRAAAAEAHQPQLHTAGNAAVFNILSEEGKHIVTGGGKADMLVCRTHQHIAAPLAEISAAADSQRNQRGILQLLAGRHHAYGFHRRHIIPEIILRIVNKACLCQKITGICAFVHPAFFIQAGPGGHFQRQ